MDLPEEIRGRLPRWREMGYEPYCVFVGRPGREIPVVFRALTKQEFSVLTTEEIGPLEAVVLGPLYTAPYQAIIRTALLWPEALDDDLPFGVDRLIAEAIVQASAWVSTQRLVEGLEEARAHASSLEGFLASRIHVAFPTLKIEDVEKMTFRSMMRLVAFSEIMTGVSVDLQPWIDPVGYQKRLEKEARAARRQRMEERAGIRVDPRMRDPEYRRQIMAAAEESKRRLRDRHGSLDFEKINKAMGAMS